MVKNLGFVTAVGILLALVFGFVLLSRQEVNFVDFNKGQSAMQIALQKELYPIMIEQTTEAQTEYKKDGTLYKNEKLKKYVEIFNKVCRNEKVKKCPEVFFTTNEMSGIANMFPNGVLAINESLMTRVNLNEATFILAHEFAHYKYQHSKQRIKVLAQAVVDNNVMLREPENAFAVAGFLDEVKKAHHKYENQADLYAFSYISSQNIQINCIQMFKKIVGNGKVSYDKHDPIELRCRNKSY